jgi:5-methylcytosine-specific restriction enzyme A
MPNQITLPQIAAAYNVAQRVYSNELSKAKGVNELKNMHQLNAHSASIFIDNFRHMMNGEVFRRALNASATDYYLQNIFTTHGVESHSRAIASVEQHIQYYENLDNGKLNKLRGVVLKHIASPQELGDFEKLFQEQVRKSSADTATTRRTRLATRHPQPTQSLVTIKVFNRNPDVVAEVLSRAKGICEKCEKPAPFKRRNDGTPYLEVHHKQQLSNNGLDEVVNAIALCPNCHRFLHHGVIEN